MHIREGFRTRLRYALLVKDTPHRIAFAFSAGLFLGFSPILGLHVILALALAWAFKLNRFVVLTGVFVTNPWTIVPIYTFCTWVGAMMLGMESVVPRMDWREAGMMDVLHGSMRVLRPFFLGTISVGALVSASAYMVVRRSVEYMRGRNGALPVQAHAVGKGEG